MLREKTLRAAITFHTPAEAMATERLCKQEGLPGKLIPAPRALTADCGIAWAGPPESRAALTAALEKAGIEWDEAVELLL